MVSLEDSHSRSNHHSPLQTRNFYFPSSTKIHRHTGCSMHTIRSNIYQDDHTPTTFVGERSPFVFENLTNSVVNMLLGELAIRH
ncbi:hypothetical protein ACFX2I_015327 [Malus domestica]